MAEVVHGTRRRPRCSARVVLLRQGVAGTEVLLVHHRHPGRAFWCFPGGGVEAAEGIASAAEREMREETGLPVAIQGVCFLQDRPDVDLVEWFFLATPSQGEAQLGHDPERPVGESPVLDALCWVPLTDLPRYQALPRDLSEALADGRLFIWGCLPVPLAQS